MAFLSFDDIMAADDMKTQVVPVPEWGGEVMIRMLAGFERDAFEQSLSKIKNGKVESNRDNFRARLAAEVLINEDGSKMITTRRQVEMLGRKSVAGLERIVDAATELNAMSESDVEKMTEGFDEESDESESSTSVSPSLSE